MKKTTRNAYRKGLAILGLAVNLVVLTVLLFVVAAGCSSVLAPRAPHPPHGKYSLDRAQRYGQRMNSTEVRNLGYRQVKP
jgi:uncharacterized protein YceK